MAIALGFVWLVALVVVVASTLTTRSELAGTQDGAGAFIVALTLPAIAAATMMLRHRAVGPLTFVAAGAASCLLAASVLNDQHSTAAIGVLAVGVWASVIVGLGIAIDRALRGRPRAGREALQADSEF
jgi:hypothetical protein